ncbi:glutathione peroxidase [Gallaecimonas sp. GXIMD4217]|uniref:glutathione peroxidase n=1 Tax=Gallaecimonas sp. GXIMD4217 TaxID=3131927 RepID=UPI00311B2C69
MQPTHIQVRHQDGRESDLSEFQGKLWLVVNTASQCGYTPQYQGLQALWEKYRERGLVVLGFPCNQFLKQEPGTDAEIGQFCERNYGVDFPLFAKTEVNGEGTHPLFAWLKKEAPGVLGTRAVKWNFTKFLVSPDGRVKRFATRTEPEALTEQIEQWLPKDV